MHMADIALETFEIDLTEPLDDNVVKDFESYNSKNTGLHPLLNGSNLNQGTSSSSTLNQSSSINVLNLNGLQQQQQSNMNNLNDSLNHQNPNMNVNNSNNNNNNNSNKSQNPNSNKVNLTIPLILPNNHQPQATQNKGSILTAQVNPVIIIPLNFP
jgi:hypothetical protein